MWKELALCALLSGIRASAADYGKSGATAAINSLGVELLSRTTQPTENALISPYSIQCALAMTYAGASGATRAEMMRVLRYPEDELTLHQSFAGLRQTLDDVVRLSVEQTRPSHKSGDTSDLIELTVANRLFGQAGFEFRPAFLALTKDLYDSPLEILDFKKSPAEATRRINTWVAEQTHQLICHLVPDGEISDGTTKDPTKLLLVNAIHVRVPWAKEFGVQATKPGPFYLATGSSVEVPTMTDTRSIGYRPFVGFCAVAIPCWNNALQFLVLLPDRPDGLNRPESELKPGLLAQCAGLPLTQEAILYLPRLKLEPPLLRLGKSLQGLGMKMAFDQPVRSADFDRMAPHTTDDYLYVSEILHRTFLQLDEKGTEAAAASAVHVRYGGLEREKPTPITVRVDHPFLFALQHRASGACLFLGRVTYPR